MRSRHLYKAILGLVFFFLGAVQSHPEGSFTLEIHPPYLEIGTFFSGRKIEISGAIPRGRDVVIEIIGPEEKSKFNLKDKVGPFWMNALKVEIEHAPSFYVVLIPEMDRFENRLPALGVGIENLKKEITIRPESVPFEKIFERFVQLKSSEKVYEGALKAIQYSGESGERRHFTAIYHFPSSITPGNYKVVAMLVHDQFIENKLKRRFRVEETGFINGIHELAFQKSLIYGLLSVIVALLVGAMMGRIFKSRRAH